MRWRQIFQATRFKEWSAATAEQAGTSEQPPANEILTLKPIFLTILVSNF